MFLKVYAPFCIYFLGHERGENDDKISLDVKD